MKRTLFIAFFAASLFTAAIAQNVIISDNFESYTPDMLLVEQSGHPWVIWNQPYHQPHDVFVRNIRSSEGDLSIQVKAGQDIVLDFADRTTGRYQLSFDIFIVTGKGGYFNILNDFNGTNSTWAFQTFFNLNGTGSVDANKQNAASYTFNHNKWINVNVIIDVDDDFASFYLDGKEIISWIPSRGARGGDSMKKLDGLCFYGYTDNDYFVDDVKFIEQDIESVASPVEVDAQFEGEDILITWSIPEGSTPESFVLIANNRILKSGITDTFFVHLNPYPNTYTYTIKAHYENMGYSHNSEPAEATRPGGVKRQNVLVEKGTATWCTYCPGAALGFKDMDNAGLNVTLISYHGSDSYTTTESSARISYYGMGGFPSTVFDGGHLMSGGSATQSSFPGYKAVFDETIEVPSLVSMTMEIKQINDKYTATINLEQHSDFFKGPFKLYGAITESGIMRNWQNQNRLDYVFRNIFPSIEGITVDFTESNEFTGTFEFELDNNWVRDNCTFVAFLQFDDNKNILNSYAIKLSGIVSIDDNHDIDIVVRPNPAIDFVSVYAPGMSSVKILNITGQLMISEKANADEHHLAVGHLPPGMYFVNIEASGKSTTRKLIIK
jgi:hypothetical protein